MNKKYGKQLTIAGKKGPRLKWTIEDGEFWSYLSKLLGYSENELGEFVMTSLLRYIDVRDETEVSVVLEEEEVVEDFSFDDFYLILNQEEGFNEISAFENHLIQITFGLELTSFELDNDPIENLLPLLSEKLNIPKQQIIKNLYMHFLDQNGILVKNDKNEVVGHDLILLRHKKSFLPYHWCPDLIKELELISSGENRFSFLNPGPFKRKNTITIQLNGEEGESIRQTLPLICKRLIRDRGSFFKMLLMYWFRTTGLVDKDFKMNPNWQSRVDVLAEKFKQI